MSLLLTFILVMFTLVFFFLKEQTVFKTVPKLFQGIFFVVKQLLIVYAFCFFGDSDVYSFVIFVCSFIKF